MGLGLFLAIDFPGKSTNGRSVDLQKKILQLALLVLSRKNFKTLIHSKLCSALKINHFHCQRKRGSLLSAEVWMMTLTLKNTVASVLHVGEHTPIVRVVVPRPQ